MQNIIALTWLDERIVSWIPDQVRNDSQTCVFIVVLLIAYLLGSIPTGKLVCKLKGVDIQSQGSGNTGATNVRRALGMRYAVLVGLIDLFKAYIPVRLAIELQFGSWQICLVAFGASLGHCYSVFLGFKGGKAVSTYLGSLLALIPFFTLGWLVVWFVLVKTIKLMSLINLVMLLLFVPALYFLQGIDYAGYAFLMWLFIIFTHRANVSRLLKGTELKV